MIRDAIRRVVGELLTPGAGSPYVRGVIAIAHALVGAAGAATFGLYGSAAAIFVGLVYWIAKERGDLRRGGAWRDGVEDTLFVAMGALYGLWWWPLFILAAAGAIMLAAEVAR